MSLLESGLRTIETYGDMRTVRKGHRYKNIYEVDNASIKKYAKFSAASYDENKKELLGYKLDESLSTPQFRCYVKGNKVVFAIRGSKEIVNDFVVNDLAGIAAGKEHLQLKQGREKLREIQEKYPNARLTLTGHSLAGLTSAALGAENQLKTYSYNPGSSPLGGQEYQDFLKNSFDNDYVTTTIAEGDAVSAGMVKHARADSLHVMANPDRSIKKTADRHFMNNFLENDHIKNISETLKEHDVANRVNIVHKLHTSGKSDESLEKRSDKLKTQLKGGGNIALNIGTHLASGGFHATYAAKNNLMKLGNEMVPKPGARIYMNKAKGVLYVFDSKHQPHFLTGTLEDKSAALKKYAKGYNTGPTIFIDDTSKTGKPKQVALVPAHGGHGWNVVSATSTEDWKTVLGGLNRHGQSGGFWSGKNPATKGKYVGNAAVDVFQSEPFRTYDDQMANKWDEVGEFIFHNAVSLIEMGAEIAADALSGGLAELAVQSINGVLSATGADSALQAELDKLLPDTRHSSMDTMDDIFAEARTVDGSKAFSGEDKNLNYDERIPFRLEEADKKFNEIHSKSGQLGLTALEEKKLFQLHPHKAADKDTQVEQAKMLDELEPKYVHMEQGMDVVTDLKKITDKAHKVGLGAVTDNTYSELRGNLIPDTGTFKPKFTPEQWKQKLSKVHEDVNYTVQNKMEHASDIYETQKRKQLDFENSIVKPMQDQMVKQEDFDKLYKGADQKKGQEYYREFQKYKNEMWQAYKTQQGFEFDADKLEAGDKYFVQRYLKKRKTPLTKYVKSDYFKNKTEEMSHLVDMQQETQQKMVADAEASSVALQATKAKTVPNI